jgi:hypothetical protein
MSKPDFTQEVPLPKGWGGPDFPLNLRPTSSIRVG